MTKNRKKSVLDVCVKDPKFAAAFNEAMESSGRREAPGTRRVVIVNDGEKWFLRRLRMVEHDLGEDQMIYYCDLPLGGPYAALLDAVAAYEGLAIVHHPVCTSDYPEKPKGEAPRLTVAIDAGEYGVSYTCSDCGAFVVREREP